MERTGAGPGRPPWRNALGDETLTGCPRLGNLRRGGHGRVFQRRQRWIPKARALPAGVPPTSRGGPTGAVSWATGRGPLDRVSRPVPAMPKSHWGRLESVDALASAAASDLVHLLPPAGRPVDVPSGRRVRGTNRACPRLERESFGSKAPSKQWRRNKCRSRNRREMHRDRPPEPCTALCQWPR